MYRKEEMYKKVGVALLVLIALGVLFFVFKKPASIYSIDGDTFSYSQDRLTPKFSMAPIEEKENWSFSRLYFTSRPFLNTPQEIYALLFIPKKFSSKVPGIVLLPGGGGTKEGEARLADILVKEGFAVLTFDQRGVGQTSGNVLPYEQDAQLFAQGKEAQQHLMVYDALAAFDVLKSQPHVDSEKMLLMGESMGGRYAIIATALDTRIKGAIAISSSGFHTPRDFSSPQQRYLASIDPDHYFSKLASRPFAMLHALNDSVVTLSSAQQTFIKAQQPKKFFLVNDSTCNHGYCDAMYDNLREALKFVL